MTMRNRLLVAIVVLAMSTGGSVSRVHSAQAVETTNHPPAAIAPLDLNSDGSPDHPDAAAALLAAQGSGERAEDVSQRTPTTQAFANPDGTWTTEVTASAVRAQDATSGEWEAIDTTLVLSRDNLRPLESSWHPESAVGNLAFSNGGEAPMATMTGTGGETLAWSWPAALPVPIAEGNKLTYAEVIPHGDLVLEAHADGFSYSVILREPPSEDVELPVVIESDSADLTRDRNTGALSFVSEVGEIASAPQPLMWDAFAGVEEATDYRPIETQVTKAGADTSLILKPDMRFLTDPDTKYPVTIDPTFTVSGSSFVNYMDPFYERDGMLDSNILIGEYESSYSYRSVFDFSLGGTPQINGSVTSATLSLYSNYATSCSPSSVTVQRVTTEDSWWWNTMPDFQPSGTAAGEVTTIQSAKGGPGACSAQGWDSWDITSIAQAWYNNGAVNNGLILTSNDGIVRSYVAPGAGSLSPRITIVSSGAPSVPTSIAALPGVDNTVTSPTPTLTSSAVDPTGDPVQLKFELLKDDAVTWTASSPYLASGATATVSIPPGNLAYGEFFTVRVSATDGSGWSDVLSTDYVVELDLGPGDQNYVEPLYGADADPLGFEATTVAIVDCMQEANQISETTTADQVIGSLNGANEYVPPTLGTSAPAPSEGCLLAAREALGDTFENVSTISELDANAIELIDDIEDGSKRILPLVVPQAAQVPPPTSQSNDPCRPAVDSFFSLLNHYSDMTLKNFALKWSEKSCVFHWAKDAECSLIPDSTPFYNFSVPCKRHDWAYGNLKRAENRYNTFSYSRRNKNVADEQFKRDMYDHCATRSGANGTACRKAANRVYEFVSITQKPATFGYGSPLTFIKQYPYIV